MSSHRILRALLVTTALAGAGLVTPALAQLAPPPPVRQSVDGNGVDLFLGTLNVNAPAISMGGSAPQGLEYYRLNRGAGWSDNLVATINITSSLVTVTFGGTSDGFTVSGSTYTSTEGNGATLSLSGTVYSYTAADGTIAHFSKSTIGFYPFYANAGRVTDITRPSGQTLTFGYDSLYYCSGHKSTGGSDICTSHQYAYRVGSVRSNYGYRVDLSYGAIDYDPDDPDAVPDFVTWGTPLNATMTNLATSGTTVTESFGEGAPAAPTITA
jgi:YD repeat-containing protein